MEPLHDFKNVINRVLEELPYTIDCPRLRKEIEEITTELRGEFEILHLSHHRHNYSLSKHICFISKIIYLLYELDVN